MQSITEQNVAGKRLIVRADLNVPSENGKVTDATRIERFAEGMKPLMEKGAILIVLSHFGRPKGVANPEYSLKFLADDLGKSLGCQISFAPSVQAAQEMASQLQNGQVMLVENVRFEQGEEKNDVEFAHRLAGLGEIYVNDAFSCAHRAHASVAAIASKLPSFGGPLLTREATALQDALEDPKRPAIAIVGGAKVSSKIDVLNNLARKLDGIIIGGGMANTFFFADGLEIGSSLCEKDQLDTVQSIRDFAAQSGCKLYLPTDIVVASKFAANAPNMTVGLNACPEDHLILDAGPNSVEMFCRVLDKAKTILWNGPLGAFELPPFDAATKALAQYAAQLTRAGDVVSVAGGGDTVAALNVAGVSSDFTYISSAGGAFLEWIEGKELPGIQALK